MTDFAEMDDSTLAGCARRDPEAFAALYRRYLSPLYRYLWRRVGSVPDAEDLTEQVFVEVLENLRAGRYRENGCFAAWLFTIARRRTVDFYRRRPAGELNEIPSPEPGLLAAIEQTEDARRLARLLTQLSEEQQELLRLRFSAGLSFAQIGQIDGRSEAAVKMAIYRALETLRGQWEAFHA